MQEQLRAAAQHQPRQLLPRAAAAKRYGAESPLLPLRRLAETGAARAGGRLVLLASCLRGSGEGVCGVGGLSRAAGGREGSRPLSHAATLPKGPRSPRPGRLRGPAPPPVCSSGPGGLKLVDTGSAPGGPDELRRLSCRLSCPCLALSRAGPDEFRARARPAAADTASRAGAPALDGSGRKPINAPDEFRPAAADTAGAPALDCSGRSQHCLAMCEASIA